MLPALMSLYSADHRIICVRGGGGAITRKQCRQELMLHGLYVIGIVPSRTSLHCYLSFVLQSTNNIQNHLETQSNAYSVTSHEAIRYGGLFSQEPSAGEYIKLTKHLPPLFLFSPHWFELFCIILSSVVHRNSHVLL